jgi:hypothetical protein
VFKPLSLLCGQIKVLFLAILIKVVNTLNINILKAVGKPTLETILLMSRRYLPFRLKKNNTGSVSWKM